MTHKKMKFYMLFTDNRSCQSVIRSIIPSLKSFSIKMSNEMMISDLRFALRDLHPVCGAVFDSSAKLKEDVLNLRKETSVLPLELSVKIAKQHVKCGTSDQHYARIFEIGVLLYIRNNREVFREQKNHRMSRFFHQLPREGGIGMVKSVRVGWLKAAANDIFLHPVWGEVHQHIDAQNIATSILGVHAVRIDAVDLLNFLSDLCVFSFPGMFAQKESSEGSDLVSPQVALRQYLSQFDFGIRFGL